MCGHQLKNNKKIGIKYPAQTLNTVTKIITKQNTPRKWFQTCNTLTVCICQFSFHFGNKSSNYYCCHWLFLFCPDSRLKYLCTVIWFSSDSAFINKITSIIYDHFLYFFSERDLAQDDVVALQDTKNQLTTHISELEQELKRYLLHVLLLPWLT